MAKKRVSFRAKGDVQKVGYRDFVQTVARKLGVVGYVENLRDGSVQIVCEGEEPAIEDFIKSVNVQIDFINVEDIGVVETSEPTSEFEYFDIKYGSIEEELGDRIGAGILYIAATREEVNQVGQKVEAVGSDVKVVGEKVEAVGSDVKVVGEKVEAVGSDVRVVGEKVEAVGSDVRVVGEKVDNLTISTTENFNELGDKYHVISENMETMNKNIEKMVDALTILVKDYVERDKQ